MPPDRPDLSQLPEDVRLYIESLESQLARFSATEAGRSDLGTGDDLVEPPGPLQVITATASGIAKRTPLHLYPRQRRGGMGIYDLDAPDDEPPALVSIVDKNQALLAITSHSRAFRLPPGVLPEAPVRARGASITPGMSLAEGETIVAIVPILAQGYLVLLSKSGMVRSLRHHIFGEYMKPGIPLYDIKSFGPLAAAAWTPGDGELLVATRLGRAIRFSEKQVPPQGCLGIRLGAEDVAVAITPVYPESKVFFLSADGHGTVRHMEGFAANKSPGSGGKNAMASTQMIAAVNVDHADSLVLISHLSKIIRFQASEVPVKEGVVQGVICMNFRLDEAVGAAVSRQFAEF
jgi:DNA gyrase subunit A